MAGPVLVGLDNPHTPDPEFALYPSPEGCSGWRLWQMIRLADSGMHRQRYLDLFVRRNLCFYPAPKGKRALREAGAALLDRLDRDGLEGETVFAFGRQVATGLGFGEKDPPMTCRQIRGRRVVHCPHPSGLTRWYNEGDHKLLVGAAIMAELNGQEGSYIHAM